MGQMDNKWDKILQLYYEHPSRSFTIRELAKLTQIPKSTVQKHLTELKKQNLVSPHNGVGDSVLFKFKKIHFFIEKIVSSGLIDVLEKELKAETIVLFGSFRKGESEKESDIDLFVESLVKKEINLKSFEKKISHSIDLFVEPDINKMPDNLKLNIINGIKLQGFLRLK
tara:strand:- start:29 stop:535 length:507 start_codon:yes stop_codon:yes gene_type:complete